MDGGDEKCVHRPITLGGEGEIAVYLLVSHLLRLAGLFPLRSSMRTC